VITNVFYTVFLKGFFG